MLHRLLLVVFVLLLPLTPVFADESLPDEGMPPAEAPPPEEMQPPREMPPAQPTPVPNGLPPGTVVALKGTPHLWFADELGVLHWAGDGRALEGHPVSWESRREVTLPELQALPRGDPWLSLALLKDGDPIYLPKWEPTDAVPQLLRIPSLADLELFGVNSSNFWTYVLERPEWERRFRMAAAALLRGELPSALSGAILITDSFDNPAAGVLPRSSDNPARYTLAYENGEYAVRQLDPTVQVMVTLPGVYSGATLAIDTRIVSLPVERYLDFGCLWSGSTGYRVELYPQESKVRLVRQDGQKSVALVDWQFWAAIKRGNGVNRVELSCADAVIAVTVNGQRLITFPDGTYRSGVMWFGVHTAPNSGVVADVRYDNLMLAQR